MKFNKLVLGLAAFPLLLTSCNSAMSRNATLNWVKNHYKAEEKGDALALTEWNFSNVKGTKAFEIVNNTILEDLRKEEAIEGLKDLIPDIHENPSGHRYHINNPAHITPLNGTNFPEQKFSTDAKNDVFKVKGDSLNVTYKCSYLYEKPDESKPETWKYVTTTNIRVYNSKGYCTDYGCKVDGKWIDKDNSIKFKLTLHFIYATDPID